MESLLIMIMIIMMIIIISSFFLKTLNKPISIKKTSDPHKFLHTHFYWQWLGEPRLLVAICLQNINM